MNEPTWLTLPELDAAFGGRRPLIKKLITIFVNTYDDLPERLGGMVRNANHAALLAELHGLKGAAGSLGARQLRDRVAGTEAAIKADAAQTAHAVEALVSFWPELMHNARNILTELG